MCLVLTHRDKSLLAGLETPGGGNPQAFAQRLSALRRVALD